MFGTPKRSVYDSHFICICLFVCIWEDFWRFHVTKRMNEQTNEFHRDALRALIHSSCLMNIRFWA